VANYTNNDVLVFNSAGTCVNHWGSTGTGPTQFRALYGITIATDPDPSVQLSYGTQELYIADANNNRVDEYSTGGTLIANIGVAGTKGATGTLGYTRRVAVDPAGNIWIADLWDWRVEEWSRTSPTGPYAYVQQIGTPLPAPTTSSVFNQVNQVAFETTGGVVTAIDAMNTVGQQLTRFTPGPTSTLINTCGLRAEGTAIPGYNWPRGVAVDPATGNLWTLDTKQYRVEILTPTCKGVGKPFGTHGTATNQFDWPYAIAIDPTDEVAWIADTWNNRIVSYNVSTMQPIAVSAASSFKMPSGIAIDPANDDILVADSGNNRIDVLTDTAGANMTKVKPISSPLFSDPQGVAADAAGNIYVANTGADDVLVFSPTGTLLTTITGGFNDPGQVAVDPSGNIYVSDTLNDVIDVFGPIS
jgi:DNA-binding beta-propeller fold protein YncE